MRKPILFEEPIDGFGKRTTGALQAYMPHTFGCPFCGSEPDVYVKINAGIEEAAFVCCPVCGASTRVYRAKEVDLVCSEYKRPAEHALHVWNTRRDDRYKYQAGDVIPEKLTRNRSGQLVPDPNYWTT